MKRSYFLGLCLTGGLLFIGAPAQAQTVTQTQTVDWTTNAWGPTGLTFNKFNTALGTLNSVTVQLKGWVRGSGTLTNNTGSPKIFTEFGVQGFLSLADATNTSTLAVVTPVSTQGPGIVSPASVVPFTFAEVFQNSGVVNLTPTSAYLGPGTVNFNASSQGFTRFTGETDITAATTSAGKAEVTLIYNYSSTPTVPEPGALALALPGLAPLGLVLRRRMGKKQS